MKRSFLVILLLLITVVLLHADSNIESKFKDITKYYEEKKYEAALKILNELKTEKIVHEKIYYYLGMIYFDTAKMQDAESNFKEAIKINPKFIYPYIELSTIMVNKRNLTEAKKYINQALSIDSNIAELHLNYSNVYLLENKIEGAKEEAKKAAEIDGGFIMNHAMSFLLNNDPKSAIFYFEILREVYPKEGSIYHNISIAYKQDNQMDEALISSLFAYYVTDPGDSQFEVYYSTYYRMCLDMERYQVIYDAAFEKVDNTYPSAYLFIALANYKQNKIEDFKKNAKKYFELDKEDIPKDLIAWAAEMVKQK